MASANLDLVRSIYAAWERGDYSGTAWADPEIKFGMADGPEPFSVTGMTEMAVAFRDFLGTWDDFRVAAQDYRELDDESILVFVHNSGTGKVSRMEIGQTAHGANFWVLRDGKVVKFVIYFDRKRALGDLGLAPEEDGS
jgi:ketosteroid isomerase-like protein